MAFSNFRLNVTVRIFFLVSLISCFLYSLFKAGWIITPIILAAAALAATIELISYVERTNREFSNFLLSIKSSDFSKYSTVDKRGRSFSDFKQALNIIIGEFQEARIDKEANYVFLQTIVEHLNTAIIAFDKTGEIKLINDAAKALLHIPYLKNINALQQIDPILCDSLTHLRTGNNPILEIDIKGDKLKLSVRSTDFSLQGVEHKLISIQNIKNEIEHTELEAWEQLLHVLTHEIMNSITPLSSLSATLKKKTDNLLSEQKFDKEEIDDLSQGLNVIEKRSIGLVNFVNQYKSLITLPNPDFRQTNIKELFETIQRLKQEQLKEKGIELKINIKSGELFFNLDPSLIEQVLINLVNNAADALETTAKPYIELSADIVNNKPVIQVTDNGPGIEKELLNKIFIPFYTTKKKGSGIGLSLSKQIMRIHSGSIIVHSAIGEGSVFSLVFA